MLEERTPDDSLTISLILENKVVSLDMDRKCWILHVCVTSLCTLTLLFKCLKTIFDAKTTNRG